ncbi:MAG: VWA domain-containing protein [Methyloprofundus sp.]|nr:VWA domain-containing protein [Methyloprofundus sp.]
MYKLSKSFSNSLYSNRFGLLAFVCLSLLTAVVLAITPDTIPRVQQTGSMEIKTRLSQTKLVQGEMSTVYLDVSIKPPALEVSQSVHRASDIIVVLDRSGSMSGANKMPYAKAAIKDLLSRLNAHDRFALVSFANNAIVHSSLEAVDTTRREQLLATVNNIQAGGGTNVGEGLNQALNLLTGKQQNRASKVLLLSDGQANQGITDLPGLSRIVSQITRQESVLSSIGMGLDFNETLMSSLADHGMGNYAYLENLSGLGDIFTQSLNATRHIYAASSDLTLKLTNGIELIDAGGYPISKGSNNSYTIKTGQLLSNNTKKFVMTFHVTAQDTGNISLGNLHLAYQARGAHQQAIASEQLNLAVVAAEHRQEAVASIDADVYKRSWLKNNLGRMQKKLSYWVREGNKDKADQLINEYRDEVAKAEKQAAMPIASEEMDVSLKEMESSVDDAFIGSRQDQELKRKRAAKSLQMGSIKKQRALQ